MNIIFVKRYIDSSSYDQVIIIEPGESGILVDDINSKVEVGGIILEGVPPGCYDFVRNDVELDDVLIGR